MGGSTEMVGSPESLRQGLCTARYCAPAQAATAPTAATAATPPSRTLRTRRACSPHPPVQCIHAPLGLGLGQKETERLRLRNGVKVATAHQAHLGVRIEGARVEPLDELLATHRSED